MKRKDTEFLHATARIRALEGKLLTQDRVERMLEAKTVADAMKLLPELGYAEVQPPTMTRLNEVLSDARRETYALMRQISPVEELGDVFAVVYDYHNVKTLLKAQARNVDASYLLVDAGRVPPARLAAALQQQEFRVLPEALERAAVEARDVLARTEDPRLADMVLDRAQFAEMRAIADRIGDAFLIGYVKLKIDAANLRSVVRATRQKQSAQALRELLLPGGEIEPAMLLSPERLQELYQGSVLEEAAEEGMRAMSGAADFVRFEKLCDDAITAYLRSAKLIPFGIAPLVAYFAAKEAELAMLRILFSGKNEDLPSEEIRERVRVAYV